MIFDTDKAGGASCQNFHVTRTSLAECVPYRHTSDYVSEGSLRQSQVIRLSTQRQESPSRIPNQSTASVLQVRSSNVGVMRECTPYVRSHLVAETRGCERHMLSCTGNRPSSSSSPSSQSSASRRCFPYPRMDSSGRRPIGVDQGTQLLRASSLPTYGVLLLRLGEEDPEILADSC